MIAKAAKALWIVLGAQLALVLLTLPFYLILLGLWAIFDWQMIPYDTVQASRIFAGILLIDLGLFVLAGMLQWLAEDAGIKA